MSPLLWLGLYRRRRMLIALTLGIIAFETLIMVVINAIPPDQVLGAKGFGDSSEIPEAFQAFSGSDGKVSLGSFAGLIGAGLVHPFWIAMQLTAIGSFGAAVTAADVEEGTIELIMTRPVSRTRLLMQRIAALVIAATTLNFAAIATVLIGVALSPDIQEAVSYKGVAIAGLMGLLLSLSIAGPVVAVSAAAHRKAHVIAFTIALGAGTFALNFIAVAWSTVHSLRFLSPFHYYSPADALVTGEVPVQSLVVLASVAILGAVVAMRLLARRDLAV